MSNLVHFTEDMMAAKKGANQSQKSNKRKKRIQCCLTYIVLLPKPKIPGILCLYSHNKLMNFSRKVVLEFH